MLRILSAICIEKGPASRRIIRPRSLGTERRPMRGNDRAQHLLGIMYEEGKGGSRDAVIALHWFDWPPGRQVNLEQKFATNSLKR